MSKIRCAHCGRFRPSSLMDHEQIEGLPPNGDPQYAFDLVDDFFCKGHFTAEESDDPCDPDNYKSCFELYCQETGILNDPESYFSSLDLSFKYPQYY